MYHHQTKTDQHTAATQLPAARQQASVQRAGAYRQPAWAAALDTYPTAALFGPQAGIQAKLTVNQPGDPHEQQADQIAAQVMRMPAPQIKRTCACGGEAGPDGECAACRAKRLAVQRRAAVPTAPPFAPPITHEVLRSPGQPLDTATRAFMEPRFARDFGGVRVHADTRAAESARAVNALAYTVGHNIVFGAGQYAPGTVEGRMLIAHELTHTLQQSQAVGSRLSPLETSISEAKPSIQRTCGPKAIGEPAGCQPFGGVSTTEISSRADERFLFEVNCDDFRPGEEARLRALAARAGAGDPIDIHGFASEEGPVDFNEHLACARARKAESVLTDAGVRARQIRAIYKHGATSGARPENRSVVIPLARPPTIAILPADFIGPPSATQRRAAASCPINCGDRNIGTMHALALFHHASRGAIVPAGDPGATGIGTSLHFTATAINIARGQPCFCDRYQIIQILTTTHPAAGRVSPYVDNGGNATPFYGDVFISGTGIHEIPAGYPDAGERIQSTRSIYDRPYRDTATLGARDLRWEAESCVACVKDGAPDRILGCATYGFARTFNAAAGTHGPVTDIGPGCRATPSADFLNTLRTDPTVAAYDFEGR